MTDTMRERIARAMCKVRRKHECGARQFVPYQREPTGPVTCGCGQWEDNLRIIDVVLDELAVPTPGMVEAGLLSTAAHLDLSGSKLTQNREKMRIRFAAMIAAAREGK